MSRTRRTRVLHTYDNKSGRPVPRETNYLAEYGVEEPKESLPKITILLSAENV